LVTSGRGAGECGRVGELTHTRSSVWGSGTGRGEAEDVAVVVAVQNQVGSQRGRGTVKEQADGWSGTGG